MWFTLVTVNTHNKHTPYLRYPSFQVYRCVFVLQGATLTQTDHSGHSPLVWAAVCGNIPNVQLLLSANGRGTPAEEQDEGEEQGRHEAVLQPLQAAACVGSEEVCLILISAGAKVYLTSTQTGNSGFIYLLRKTVEFRKSTYHIKYEPVSLSMHELRPHL